jgi:hypothetical protein
MRLKWD